MITTGKVAEYITKFEEFEAKLDEKFPKLKAKVKPLTEDDQINLFKIASTFKLDEVFKSYIIGCFYLYGKARMKGKGTLLDLFEVLSLLDDTLGK